jgi:hypothetical protein
MSCVDGVSRVPPCKEACDGRGANSPGAINLAEERAGRDPSLAEPLVQGGCGVCLR